MSINLPINDHLISIYILIGSKVLSVTRRSKMPNFLSRFVYAFSLLRLQVVFSSSLLWAYESDL